MARTQVIIAGAGPVGTVAAYYLAEQGVSVVLLESAASCEEDMRASTLHSPTLALLDSLGITQQLIAVGLKAPVYHYRIRATDEVLEFDLSELSDELEFPFRLQCILRSQSGTSGENRNEQGEQSKLENGHAAFQRLQKDQERCDLNVVTQQGQTSPGRA